MDLETALKLRRQAHNNAIVLSDYIGQITGCSVCRRLDSCRNELSTSRRR